MSQKKINAVTARFAAMAANRLEAEGGDEFPTPTREQVDAFSTLVRDMANLVFAPDYKDRNVLDITIVSSKEGKVHTFFEEPFDPYDADLTEAQFMRGLGRVLRTATSMMSTGQRILDRFSDTAQFRASAIEKTDEKKSDMDNARALLEAGKLDEFRAEADRLMEKHDPPLYAGTGEAAKTPYNRNDEYREIPDELMDLINEYGLALKAAGRTAEIDAAIAEIDTVLKLAEAQVGLDHKTHGSIEGSFDESSYVAKEALYKHRYRFGDRALSPVVVRHNRMRDEHRIIVRLREKGMKVVPVTQDA